jgi:vacuolar-type H+-ATPase subunit H
LIIGGGGWPKLAALRQLIDREVLANKISNSFKNKQNKISVTARPYNSEIEINSNKRAESEGPPELPMQ